MNSEKLAYEILRTSNPDLLYHIYRYDVDGLYDYAENEGSVRFVASLGNGWMVKAPLWGDEDGIHQSYVEYHTYNNLEDADYYSPTIITTPKLLQHGILLVREAQPLEDYLFAIHEDAYDAVYTYETLTSGHGAYMIEQLGELLGDEVHEYEGLLNSLDLVLDWIENYGVKDAHMGNFGILDNEVVMLDLGWGV